MLIFGLATSFPVFTEVEIKNNSSLDLRIIIAYFDRRLPDTEANVEKEFEVKVEESISIRGSTSHNWFQPYNFIQKIIVFNEKANIFREFNYSDFMGEDFFNLHPHQRRGRSGFFGTDDGNTRFFVWEITDELLE